MSSKLPIFRVALVIIALISFANVAQAERRAALSLAQRLKPLMIDRDKDAIPDSIERKLGLNSKRSDTDGDKAWDGEEKYKGTNKTIVQTLDAGTFDTMILKLLGGSFSANTSARTTLKTARKQLAKACTSAGQSNCRLPICSATVTRNCRKPLKVTTPTPRATPTPPVSSIGNPTLGSIAFQGNCSGCHSALSKAGRSTAQISAALRDNPFMAGVRVSSSELSNIVAYLNQLN